MNNSGGRKMGWDRTGRSTFSYLRRHYFADDKLRDLAIEEFVRAMRSGRLIAFTGSFSTAPCGYPGWKELFEKALTAAKKALPSSAPAAMARGVNIDLVDTLEQVSRRDPRFDGRVTFSAVAQMLDHLSRSHERTEKATREIAALYKSAVPWRHFSEEKSTVHALFDDLKIKRVVTTNYDFELERYAMDIATGKTRGKRRVWPAIASLIKQEWFDRDGSEKDGYSLVASLANGERVVSDIMQRERPEALIEFAIGCPEIDTHIFHLHGRADQPEQMILSYRDYDRLYRRRGLGKVPFEHALRILFAGNPILFVGLGMDEPELNKTLEEFVGNNPYARKAPAFLIWNKPKTWTKLSPGDHDESFYADEKEVYPEIASEKRKAAFRLDKLHRLGILTIFADDLGPAAKSNFEGNGCEQLRKSLVLLSRRVRKAHETRRAEIRPERWRNAHRRIRNGLSGSERIIHSWHVVWVDPKLLLGHSQAPPRFIKPLAHVAGAEETPFINVVLRPAGADKTNVATAMAGAWIDARPNGRAVIINFNMRIDTDSILAFILGLFHYDPGKKDDGLREYRTSRQRQFENRNCRGLASGEPLLLVLKGLERIFDVNGHPLSAEFDEFLRTVINRVSDFGNVRFVVIGTERIRDYFEGWQHWLDARARRRSTANVKPASAERVAIIRDETKQVIEVDSPYMRWLREQYRPGRLDDARHFNKKWDDYAAQRRTLYQTVLSPSTLRAHGIRPAEAALDIVTIMSFIGQPVEKAVLFHAPRLQQRLGLNPRRPGAARANFNAAFNLLLTSGLIREVNRSPTKMLEHQRRYTVHLSLQTEIRDRNGIPLSDSILSTAYNMSLFSAQPADGALPEADLHDELGRLVDWLIGAYKDPPLDPRARRNDRSNPHVVASYRAGFALVRGLYSTSALLSVDRGDRLVSEDRDGLLTEHAQRLDRMLEAFDAIWRSRGDAPRPDDPEPLYPDELVWLHNERGVVKLAQGDLYEARFSLNEADRINRAYVEFHEESHNWRRITLNQIVVDIERGRLQSAEDRMNAIERNLGAVKRKHIHRRYVEKESTERIRFDPIASHEDILSVALITGYRGLTSHLRGELDAASHYFVRAIRVLQRMDEQRALALFRRHQASLLADLRDLDGLRRESRLSVSGAESVRQLDIVYSGRLMEACAQDRSTDPVERKQGFRAALEALEYATLADLHRLSIEAQGRLAWTKFNNGDYDAALEHISEAMAIATRYGLTLYKISLRATMGLILIKRGNMDAGRTLIRNAINGAVRIGYQRAIENARVALAETMAVYDLNV